MPSKESALFENLFLRGIADALLKRRKALKHQGVELAIERGVDRQDGLAFERLDLTLRSRHFEKEGVWFTAWEDSAIGVFIRRVRKREPALKAEISAVLWEVEPAEIVRRIEATRLIARRLEDTLFTTSGKDALQEVWTPPKAPRRRSPGSRRP